MWRVRLVDRAPAPLHAYPTAWDAGPGTAATATAGVTPYLPLAPAANTASRLELLSRMYALMNASSCSSQQPRHSLQVWRRPTAAWLTLLSGRLCRPELMPGWAARHEAACWRP